jgi:hypothetical protein
LIASRRVNGWDSSTISWDLERRVELPRSFLMNFRNGIGAHLDDQANTTLGRHWGSILSILDGTDGTVDRVTLTGEHERVDDEGDEEEVGLGEEDTEYAGVGGVDLSSGNGGMSTRRSTR